MANEVATQGITVTVELAPNGTASGSPVSMGVLQTIDGMEKTRATKKYPGINTDAQPLITGRLEYAPVSMTVTYNPSTSNGENVMETAIDTNQMVKTEVELNNSLGAHGTTYSGLYYVSKFKKVFESDGLVTAEITAEINGTVTTTDAA